MFHVFPAPEFQLHDHGCIDGATRDRCNPQAMTLVVMCGSLLGRFSNCNRKHAEEFLVTNKTFYHYVRQYKPRSMVFFMKNHPCHHSSGNAKRYPDGYLFNGKPDSRSCTDKVIRYFREVLQPNGTSLIIHTAWLYKAFWQFARRADDLCAVNQSKEGLRLLLESGIVVQDMHPHHWILMANLCTTPILLSNLLSPARLRADRLTQEFITKMKDDLRKKMERNKEHDNEQEDKDESRHTSGKNKRLNDTFVGNDNDNRNNKISVKPPRFKRVCF